MNELVLRGFFMAQSAYGTLLERMHSEQGISTAQYSLLVALVALVVALLVGAFGSGIKGLFGTAHTCMNGLTTTACRVSSTDVK